jgi:hypothetical protein
MTFYILVLNGFLYVEGPTEGITFCVDDYEDAYNRIQLELTAVPNGTKAQVIELFLE